MSGEKVIKQKHTIKVKPYGVFLNSSMQMRASGKSKGFGPINE
jgi:hypothetical protein